ncbi:uncharacterized protein LOC131245633 [Magnolia sinica]|uniref:uncharacterized protein LOC131245633 n=1 Tax=Magnolia sinica TaxID=86752 RepID=UPI002659B20B|nr:uncharacterized protein LOC131245633 [Magnolia sinica]
MQNVDTGNAQASLQHLHGGYKALASSSHNVDANNHDVPSASNDLNNPVNNMQKVMPVLKEGQEFKNANAFHEALREYAIRSNFQYRRTRSGHGRFQAKCIKDDCLWCIRACKLPNKPTFKIKLLKGNHTCNAANEPTMSNTKTHQQANRKWIATLVKDRLRKNLDCTPKDIVDEISREYKIEVSYDKAWRGKELALKEMHFELSYPDLRMLCKDIEMTNPGSMAKLSRSSDNSLRLFIAYKAAVCGFKKACRPVVRLEHMKKGGEYPGEWFFASAIDATCVDFPVSYAFVESESIESWKWFCGELTQVLESISGLTFISDRQEGILEDVRDFFPYACHRYRLKGLFDEIRQKFECDELLDLFRSATYAPFHSEFDDCMRQIQGKYKEAWNFVKDINPKHWATSHFEGKFNVYCDYLPFHMLYMVVCWGNWPITLSLLRLHGDITRAFSCRFEESSECTTIFVSCVQDVISSVEKDSERYFVSGSATEFEVVVKGEGAFKVDIQRGACPCLFSQRHAYPCEHVIAAILYSGCNVYEFLDYFTVAKYRETYSEVIHPLTFKPELMKKRKYVHH